ncbi:MAG: restriction endonuclease subunit S [Leptospiraceae bacterium]|nr:restriction endonuclease subunit S [Leptospiraceae bacterium]MCK6381835.1 restriction endonuclease subunit S [Leptospiraceae bacterium]
MSQLEITTLGKSCEFFNGKAHEKSIDENGKYIVVNSKFISQEGRVVKRTKEQMFPLYKGDIVMVMSDVPNGKALAKCFIIDKDDIYSLNQRICCIRSKEFDTKYLYYQLNRHEHFLAFNNGENQTNLRKDDILACPLIKPSMEEQKRMVAELDNAYSMINAVCNNLEVNYQNSKELFRSELNKLFTTKNEHWIEKELAEISKINYGYTEKASSQPIGPKYLRITDIQENGVDWETVPYCKCSDEDYTKYALETGDIVFARTGATTGKSYLLENPPIGVFASYLIRLKINSKDVILPKLIYYFFQSGIYWKEINEGITGAAQGGFNASKLGKMKISFPISTNEQKQIIDRLDQLFIITKTLGEKYTSKLESVEELKSGVLKRAFENELIEAE